MKELLPINTKGRSGFRLSALVSGPALLVVFLAVRPLFPVSGHTPTVTFPQYEYQGDRFAELAGGVFHEDLDGIADAGAVNVFYGRETPYTFYDLHRQFWTQKNANIRDIAENEDKFGSALVSGDFNGDYYPDLAIGVPLEDVLLNDTLVDAGAVNVLYGTETGLSDVDDDFWIQEHAAGVSEPHEYFGTALASGDFDNDGYDDLAIGTPGEKVDGQDAAGVVDVLYGSYEGLSTIGDQTWHQNKVGIQDGAQAQDQFGTALASGDFNLDGYDDLAVGIPFEDIEGEDTTIEDAGAVNIIFGSTDGLTSNDSQFLHQGILEIEDYAETNDRFGWSLAAGRLNGDNFYDLAVGVPQESLEDISQAGAVSVLFGYDYGISTVDQFWHQDEASIKEEAENYDRFGWALAIGDFDASGIQDLAVGVPMEDLDGEDDAGAVHVLYSIFTGPHDLDNQLWHQDIGTVVGELNSGDRFGHALAAGNFDGDEYDDLAVGVPGEQVEGISRAGWVNVLLGGFLGITDSNDSSEHQDKYGAYDDGPQADDNFGSALAVLQPPTYRAYLPLLLQTLQ